MQYGVECMEFITNDIEKNILKFKCVTKREYKGIIDIEEPKFYEKSQKFRSYLLPYPRP